jgi:hypothetical protein
MRADRNRARQNMAGQSVLRGTRVRPRDLPIDREAGIDWLARNHGIEPEAIRKLFAFYGAHKSARVLHNA